MQAVVINVCYGGFNLSDEQKQRGREISGNKMWGKHPWNIPRDDPTLVRVVRENVGDAWCSELKVVLIPDDVKWKIQEYDGVEHVAEKHRTWG